MPRIVCRACGREIYTSAPVEDLFAEERRCPRCGASLQDDRRATDRRTLNRRENPPQDPGPPEDLERRVEERRKTGRRRGDAGRRSTTGGPE
jgi:DNA-directed RNA polymerase subunit RPC12/RpoP